MNDTMLVTQLTMQVTNAVAASIQNVFNQLLEKQTNTDTRIGVLEHRIEQEITLNYKEQLVVEEAKRLRVRELMKAKFGNVTMTKEMSQIKTKLFRRMGQSLKTRFLVNSYKDIKRHELNDAKAFIEIWEPDWELIINNMLESA